MGEWRQPDTFGALMAIADRFHVTDPEGFAAALVVSGLIVRERYYVPDTRELFGLMRQWSYHMKSGTEGCRWVMCRETFDALARQYTGARAPAPMTFDATFWRTDAAADLPPAALEMNVLQVIEQNRRWEDHSMLLGLPIRIDPAARSPLFEIDSADTR